MYLKHIELMGFKSFPEKIQLEFGKGITAVVGPNGSGKSNIADGVRWVLGEQSAKSLRGSKMEDVIFSGTANRRALGLAEVSLVLDNSDAALPLDYDEVKISRRVFRSGESEYAMNGTPCRLRDIHELFMDTGVGKEGYSIIGQGRIEEILSTRSEDRRLLFEEAAGIVKYKSRRQDAEAKLARERDNLVRLRDILSELENQIEVLEPQSEKARQYLELRERLKLLQVNLFLIEAAGAEKQLEQMSEAAAALQAQLEDEKTLQDRYNNEISDLKSTDMSLDQRTREANARLLELSNMMEQKESDYKLTSEKISHILLNIERVREEIDKKSESLDKSAAEKESEAAKLSALELLSITKYEILDKKLADFQEFDVIMHERAQHLEKLNSGIIEGLKKTTEIKSNKRSAEDLYERLEQQMEQLNEDMQYNRSRILENKVKLESITKALEQLEDEFEKLDVVIESYVREKDNLNIQHQESSNAKTIILKKLNELRSRHKLLTELERDYEGYNKSVKAVLKRKRAMPDAFRGICGAVAELGSTSREYETAIEIALGGAIQNIVTKTEEDAKQAIAYLKASGEGRATFLPMTAIKAKYLSDQRILSEKGILGIALNKLRFEPQYEVIFSNLLGQVVIADTLENAVNAFKKYRHSIKIVTLEGDLLSPGGSMTGGSVNQRSAHIFTRSRELAELPILIKELIGREEDADQTLMALEQKINTTTEEIQKTKDRVQSMALEKNTMLNEKNQTESLLARLAPKESELKSENARLMSQLEDTNRTIRELDSELSDLDMEIEDLQANIESYQSAASSDKEDRDGRTREITDLKVELSGLEEKTRAVSSNITRIEREISEKKDDIEKLGREIERSERDKCDRETEMETFIRELSKYRELLAEKRGDLARMDDEKDEIRIKLNKTDRLQKECADTITRLANELTKLEMRKEQRETDNRRSYDRMWDDYKITYQAALEYRRLEMAPAQMQQEEKRIRSEIHDMGDVNVGAIEDFKTVKARHEHLKAQIDDILSTEEKLQGIINTLTELMETQFREQFRIISDNFGAVFKEMFGGGQAALRLNDENNALTSGIDIIAQPPGKNLQSMSLLSGGERALTATALLFGILRMKPSPFCILDEIEAALDDANVIRLANYLKNISDNTQFILITHRKGTMTAADTLYGVTMQEQGVSKLVSVTFG